MEIKQVNFREEYYNDIHDMKPKWWMRWGILSVFIILFIILSLGYIVKYPDAIRSEFRLTTNKPSITLHLPHDSHVEKLFIKDRDKVKPKTNLVVIENTSDYKDILSLSKEIESFSFERDSILVFFDKLLNIDLQLGSKVENDWNVFTKELLEYYKIEKLETFQLQVGFLKNELTKQYNLRKHYQELIVSNKEQKQLLKQQIETDSILFSKGVISKMTFYQNKRDYLTKKEILGNNNLSLKRINLDILKLNNSIVNINNNEEERLLSKKLSIRRSLNRLKSSIESWKIDNLLISPIEGQISFLQDLKEESSFNGDVIVITPNNKEYYATVNIPLLGAGKVEVGQRVILKLNDYPHREFGVIEGELVKFSSVSNENYYLGKVIISKDEMSSYDKKINLKENMRGVAEIITNDRNLLGRLFEKLTYAFNQ